MKSIVKIVSAPYLIGLLGWLSVAGPALDAIAQTAAVAGPGSGGLPVPQRGFVSVKRTQ
ncbi:MAG: hypothetical protein K9N23_21900 [Akkermansiaceae bacterium]|nr:hypothetical protein [Akkermansiaceae bacterium]